MKNIYKRKDGRYEYSKMIDNERIYIIKSTKKELEKEVREIKQKNKKQRNKYLFKNIVNEWYTNFKEPYIGKSAKQVYHATINNYLLPELGNKSINKITFKDLQLLKEFAKEYVNIPEIVKNQTSDIIYDPQKADETRLKFIMDDGKILYLRIEDMADQLNNRYDYVANKEAFKNKCVFSFEGNYVYMKDCE